MIKRGRWLSIMLICSLFLISSGFLVNAEVSTGLIVGYNNVPPVLIESIPDQAWAINTNITNIFDLDDYFIDNETLTYSSTAVANITVVINSTTNEVSFYPDYDFSGVRTVTFSAMDASTSTDSNLVTLNVTADLQPPTWSNPGKSKVDSQIFQNTVVVFTADWIDDVELGSFIFSIKQEGGWINQSVVSFSGLSNTSSYSQQISAPAGTQVNWRFFGFDTSDNSNVTDIQNFTVSSSPSIPPVSDDGEGDGTQDDAEESVTTTTGTKETEVKKDFTVSPSESYKLDLKQGSSGTITIKVSNTGNTDLEFDIDVSGLEQFEKLISEKRFNLTAGDSKSVTIEFSASSRLMPDLYYGEIKIKTESGVKDLPLVIAVNALETELSLNLNISEEYRNLKPGDKIVANITLSNLGDIEERNVTLYYAIKSFKDETVDSAFEEFIFNSKSVELEKTLIVPEQIRRGEYIFFTRAVSEKNILIDSEIFYIGEEFSVSGFVKANIFFLGIILASILVAVLMMRQHKNKERMRLLNLYLLITELNKLIKEGKHEEAIGVYVRIKSAYGEPVSRTSLENKTELKKEMEQLADKLDVKVLQKIKEKVEKDKEADTKDKEADTKDKEADTKDKEADTKDKEADTKDKEADTKDKEADTKDKEADTKDKEADTKDKEADTKDKEADTKDKEADTKDKEADTKDKEADTKDKEADTKDKEADTKDKEADTKDKEADTKDKEADTKDKEADTKDKEADTKDKEADTKDKEADTKDKDSGKIEKTKKANKNPKLGKKRGKKKIAKKKTRSKRGKK